MMLFFQVRSDPLPVRSPHAFEDTGRPASREAPKPVPPPTPPAHLSDQARPHKPSRPAPRSPPNAAQSISTDRQAYAAPAARDYRSSSFPPRAPRQAETQTPKSPALPSAPRQTQAAPCQRKTRGISRSVETCVRDYKQTRAQQGTR